MHNVLSLGAGVQSSTVAMLITHKILPPVDFAVFADTQGEPQSVYDWLEYLKSKVSFPIYIASQGNLAQDSTKIHVAKNGTKYLTPSLPVFTLEGNKEGMMIRQCTRGYKVRVVRREIRRILGGIKQTRLWMGISLDEVSRMRPAEFQWLEHYYPLIEMEWTRSKCLEWWKENNLPTPPRSACVFCPYHNEKEWLRLKTEEPKEFIKAVEYEKQLQEAAKETTIKNIPYLHRSRQPLDQVEFKSEEQEQGSLFNDECEGMCGI